MRLLCTHKPIRLMLGMTILMMCGLSAWSTPSSEQRAEMRFSANCLHVESDTYLTVPLVDGKPDFSKSKAINLHVKVDCGVIRVSR